MALNKRTFRTLILAVACLCPGAEIFAQSESEKSYVMLLNGNVFHGIARPMGDRLELRLSQGNSIHLDSKQVAFIAPTKVALYERQVQGARRLGANEHWYLTQWCIQEGLVDQAIHHFEVLAQLVEPNDRFKQLEHKLKEAIINSEKVRNLLGERHPNYMPSDGDSPENPASNGTSIVHASFSAASPKLTDEQTVLLSSMPSYVKKSFQSHITPLLVSRCGQAGCHGLPGGDTQFHIRQAVGDQAATVVARNLENVIRYVNPNAPAESELIAYATKAHSSQSQPRFQPHARDDDQRHIERITQWIKSLALTTPAAGSLNGIAPNAITPNGLPAGNVLPGSANQIVPTQVSNAAVLDNNVVSAVAMEKFGNATELPVSAVATAINSTNMPSTSVTNNVTNNVVNSTNAPSSDADTDGRSSKIQEWREFEVEQDRSAKLSKAPRTGVGPSILSYDELQQLENAIERLEKKQAAKPARDPFDPNYFNATYGGKK